jgi:aryl-alcohol dehydrogenase-like predicted oxidoreductase
MEQRKIGKSDLLCSTVGYGTWEMSGNMYGDIDVDAVTHAIHSAIDHGINLFDTAEVYGPFHSEILLGKALGDKRKEVIIVDKVGFIYDERRDESTDNFGGLLGRHSEYHHIIKRTEGCLRRLNTDVIDLMLIHWPDFNTALDEPMRALEKLKAEGKIRYGGVSNFNTEMMDYGLNYTDIVANQVGYHLFDQRMEKSIFPYCQEKKIGFMGYGTLGFGLLTGAFTPQTTFADNDWRKWKGGDAFWLPLFQKENFLRELKVGKRLAELAAGYGKSLPQLAIAWALRNEVVSVALVGIRNEQEMKQNVEAAEWHLTETNLKEIDTIFKEENCPTYFDYPMALSD